ncbi:MAG: 50S ribosomal protein L30 [Bacteroidetes bacterium]|jgi:large subunit ribosomal protein L30|nr:50S ribosomal protein L30 [Bacteroidota bacterium]OUW83761.1 MAG: 50S ribosomal protein L30 [Saprospirales bacterium TMED214]RCL62680.1 MAG: 50S ribosomal protein L30 [Bacteroidota bacterium]|tara:strand:- start:1597 stop:1776 length:180 start_codon:yes stop_codon:yes gene_type:complete
MSKLRVTQVRSIIDRPERQKRTMKAIGLRKMNQTVEVANTPEMKGMIASVAHLLKVEEV